MSYAVSRRRFLEATLFAGATSVMASRLAFANAPTESRLTPPLEAHEASYLAASARTASLALRSTG